MIRFMQTIRMLKKMEIEKYYEVKDKVTEAEAKSPFHQHVTLVAVSKTHPVSDIKQVYDAGQRDFGENKVQEILEKYDQLPSDIRWHMIGHLQTNKVKYIIDKVCMIHSVDSLKLAQVIDKEAKKFSLCMPILIEVNIGDEDTKSGVKASETAELIKEISALSNVRIDGLMCIPPACHNELESRKYFKALRDLSIDIERRNIDNVQMNVLSMGMSDDYEAAIAEGADIVRVGTSIFGMRDYSKR